MDIKPEDASSDSFRQVYNSNLSVLKTDAFREFKTTSEFKKYVNIYKSKHFDTKDNWIFNYVHFLYYDFK